MTWESSTNAAKAPIYREGDLRRWCFSTRKADRVRKEYEQLWLAISNVSKIAEAIVGNQSDYVVGLALQVRCPRDVAAVERRVPDEIDGVPLPWSRYRSPRLLWRR
jgi:hypothetical protein